jgi:hypothetical protein
MMLNATPHKGREASVIQVFATVDLDALPTLFFVFVSTHFEPTQQNTNFDTDTSRQAATMQDPMNSRILEDVQHRDCRDRRPSNPIILALDSYREPADATFFEPNALQR